MKRDWKILEHDTAYQGFFRIDRYRLQHTLFEGGWSDAVTREVFERGHAVAVLPYDPARDQVLLVEQFRIGALAADAPGGPWLLELIAGIIEDGEAPEEVARREAREEAGCELGELEFVCDYLVSPGGTSERTCLYLGRTNLEQAGGVHGLDTEHEDIRVHVVDAGEAIAMADDGRIANAAGVIGLYWLARHHARLRGE
ncbi:MAG: NUDIX domain-containing protein [Halofilum sp. (in: g-proteobacteria)]|nr:NUDIX domain-containing protein [Halofilum sp. (in: g-proteobacteria)]